MPTGSYDTSPAPIPLHDPYNQGPPPPHPPPPSSQSPTHYQHQPIPPPGNTASYANQPPAGSPPPQIAHAYPPPAMASPGQEKHEYYNAGAGATPAHQQSGIPMQTHPGMPPQQHSHPGMPPQQQSGGYGAPNTQVYHTVTPLASLSEGPAPVDCPVCHTRAMTRCEKHSGNTVHAWAAVLCICLCLGCIPYLIKGLKDTEHSCGHCGVMLATYKNSGHTVVHQHG